MSCRDAGDRAILLVTGVQAFQNSRIGEVMAESQKSKAEAQPRPDPNEKLVKVFESEEETGALVVKGLLESASIESDVAPLDCRVPPKTAGR